MKPLSKLFSILILLSLLLSCNKPPEQKPPPTTPKQINKDSITKLTAGEYSGTLPCADCPGIEYVLTLQPSMDFSASNTYLEKNVSPLKSLGKWQMIGDSIIILLSTTDAPSYLRNYNNDSLEMLDDNKQRMSGPTPSSFVLRRVKTQTNTSGSSPVIPDENFVLETFDGQAVNAKDYMKGLPEIKIDVKNGSMSGSTGCNRMFGEVTVNGNEISLLQIATTRMRCPGQSESIFLDAMRRVDSFKVDGEKLILMTGQRQVAVFGKGKN